MNNSNDAPLDQHEWEIQERAMRAAHDQVGSEPGAASVSYRRVADALRSTPLGEPPDDFASTVVLQIAQQDAGIERTLCRGLFVMLASSSVVMTAIYGEQWWQALRELLGDGSLQWVLPCTGCVALSWIISQLRRTDLLAYS